MIWKNFAWLIEIGVFLIVIVVANFFLRRLVHRFKHQYSMHQSDWRYHFDAAILAPFKTLLWILFVSFVIDLVARQFEWTAVIIDPVPLRNAGIVICATWFFFRWKTLFEKVVASRRIAGKKTLDPASLEIISKIYTISVLFIAILILLQNFGLNITPFITFGGIGAAALGFASKDMIANFYGGLTIYLARPFLVNECIELPQKNLSGTIEKIGWYFTTLRDVAMKPYYIPNAFFTTEFVINISRITNRYINEILPIRYTDYSKLEELIQKIRDFLAAHPDIDARQPVRIFILGYGESSINLEIRAYTKTTDFGEYVEIKQKILIQICDLLARFGTAIGYPMREILLSKKE
ncbi:MAG TPA: mechanosensitive ion channel family protein [Chlamydiales bacterium]|nr:mechanosensitive ion channel family protein [Chlamydiales bacterium]